MPEGRQEESTLHTVMITSTVLLVSMLMVSAMILLTPSLSPVSSIADWDGDGFTNSVDAFPRDGDEWKDTDFDGVGDNEDAFPYDGTESSDSDEDGVGDNKDMYDSGNGGIMISLTRFEYLGTRTSYDPNPWFQIKIDVNDDGTFEQTLSSEVYNGTRLLTNFYDVLFDLPDDWESIRFTILACDVSLFSSNNVVSYEILDYTPTDGLKSMIHEVDLPVFESWDSNGLDDTDTPDCALAYSISTVRM